MRSRLFSFTAPSPAFAIAAAALVVSTGCRGGEASSADTPHGGTLVAGLQTEVMHLVPPALTQVEGKTVADQIFEPLARVGDDGYVGGDVGFRPALADRWTWERDSLALVFHLSPSARWHDGTPVRSSDVHFTYALYTDPAVGSGERASLSRIDSVTARDSVTVVFWFAARYPEQFYDAATRMLIVPEHLLGNAPRASLSTSSFARNPIGSGPFRLGQWSANESIELVADTTYHRGRAHLDRVIFAVTPDPNALTARLASGEIDAAEIANAAQFRTLSRDPDLRARILPAFDYGFLQFNLRDPKNRARPHPIFGDAALRRALSMAVDRAQIVRAQLDTLGAVALGPMTRAQPLADTTVAQIPFDTAAAARTLDSLGWRLPPGKTVRERSGRPLRFSVLVPSVSPNRVAMVVRLQESLRRVGVQLDVDALEANTFIARVTGRDFDAVFNGMHVEVSLSGLRAYWTTAESRNPRGRNFSSYENPRFDAHLDSALSARDDAGARAHARQAFAEIVADAPAIWIYEVRTAPMIHHRFRTARVLPGAWWAGFADWSVPLDARIPRDRVAPRMVAR